MPRNYELPDNEDYILITNSQDLDATLDHIGMPEEYRQDITAAIIKVDDGEYSEVYLTESARYYDAYAEYNPPSYYFELPKDANGNPIYLTWYR